MMDFFELVKKRQSVRRYSRKPVPREVIERCLEAARLAPSACNSQPWYFIVIDDVGLKKKVTEAAFSGVYSINSFVKNAPVVIVVVTRRAGYITRLGGYFRGIQYSLIDIGIACEHLMLQAAEKGVGTCWIGWFNEKAVKRILRLSQDEKVNIIISMGYPEGQLYRDKRRKPMDKIRRFNM